MVNSNKIMAAILAMLENRNLPAYPQHYFSSWQPSSLKWSRRWRLEESRWLFRFTVTCYWKISCLRGNCWSGNIHTNSCSSSAAQQTSVIPKDALLLHFGGGELGIRPFKSPNSHFNFHAWVIVCPWNTMYCHLVPVWHNALSLHALPIQSIFIVCPHNRTNIIVSPCGTSWPSRKLAIRKNPNLW